MSRILISFLLAATAVVAQQQQPPRFFTRAVYTKWKPGMRIEGERFLKEAPLKAARNWLKTEPSAVGQVTMSRVLPGGTPFEYDRLRLVIYNAPPDLSGARSPGTAYLDGAGISAAEYTGKLRSMMDVTHTEIWESVYRHGSIKEGDYVRALTLKPAAGKTASYLEYLREWESAMRAEIVKSGPTSAQESWQVRFVATEYPNAFVSLIAFPNSDAAYQSFGNRHGIFVKAHPGKDYHLYREKASETGERSSRSVTYHVDQALWK